MKYCSIDNCKNDVRARMLCNKHYLVEWRSDRLENKKPYDHHSRYGSPEYTTWSQMKARCYNEKSTGYYLYGGRGIKVCNQWLNSFSSFYSDMGKRPIGTSIERKNVDGEYSPQNCFWATNHQQAANKRNRNEVVGVSFDKQANTWQSQLIIKGKQVIKPRRHKTFEEAVAARTAAELLYLGYKI